MPRFEYFAVFADMRTGSNFLETNINAFDGLHCHGEAFNPQFIGDPTATDVLGITKEQRDAEPFSLIEAIKAADGLNGFRYFNDHDGRILDACLTDHRCAKIILTRNPIESYVSLKIAAATGQWKLTQAGHARTETVSFDAAEFEQHLAAAQAFQLRLLSTLQKTGQAGFYLDYEDLQDVDVMNGLAQFLGSESRVPHLNRKLKKQNPEPMAEKVANFPDMEAALARIDRFNLSRTPNFEPRRGPVVPSYVAAAQSALLYLPLRSGPNAAVEQWLADLDGVSPDALRRDFTQKLLREWLVQAPGHRSFSVLRHPVAWAHTAFCKHILATDQHSYPDIRATLCRSHGLVLPDQGADPTTDSGYDLAAHRTAFLGFLRFLRSNLSSQTAMRTDAAWSTQYAALQGISGLVLPDLILREDRLGADLAMLAAQVGRQHAPPVAAVTDHFAGWLAPIYDREIEAAARDAYVRDYLMFGFGDYAA